MRKNKILSVICGFSMFFSLQTAMGQDMQLSQYDASPILLNPALTGMKQNLKYRIVQQYRNQWDAVTQKSFLSSALSYDMNLKQKWVLHQTELKLKIIHKILKPILGEVSTSLVIHLIIMQTLHEAKEI